MGPIPRITQRNPFNHPAQNQHWKRMIIKGVVGVYTIGGWTNMRALSVWEKHGQLELGE